VVAIYPQLDHHKNGLVRHSIIHTATETKRAGEGNKKSVRDDEVPDEFIFGHRLRWDL